MEKEQISKLEMLDAVDETMDNYTAVWSAIPKVAETKNTISQLIISIRETAGNQKAARVFVGKTLRKIKKTVADKMDVLDDILEAYAEEQGYTELLAKASNTMTDYYRLSHESFETKVKLVIGLMEAHLADLADYGFSQELLDDAKASFGEFEALNGKPRSYQIASRVATTGLEAQLTEAMEHISKLDKLLKRFRRSNTAFYNAYEAARVVI